MILIRVETFTFSRKLDSSRYKADVGNFDCNNYVNIRPSAHVSQARTDYLLTATYPTSVDLRHAILYIFEMTGSFSTSISLF